MKNKYLKLSYILLIPLVVLSLASCSPDSTVATDVPDTSKDKEESPIFTPCEDLGKEYIDSFIFIGESTTYHLKSRGVLSGGTQTKQVWASKSGTATLDARIASLRIVYPETGEEMSIYDAAKQKKPQRLILTFGLNGALAKYKSGEKYFKSCYLLLIDEIRRGSPQTEIIIQSCFPISDKMDTSAYLVDAKTLNEYIDTINGWALTLAKEEGLGYLNTQEVLRDSHGYLRKEYDAGDGYHISTEGYKCILEYIRTHKKEN